MHIGFYGRALANRAGIGRYARELFKAMVDETPEHQVSVFVGREAELLCPAGTRAGVVSLGGRGNRIVEEQGSLAAQLRRHSLDVLHNPDFTLPLMTPHRMRTVVTVHDVAYVRHPESNSRKSQILLNAFVPRAVHKADAIIAVSEFTKQEIEQVYGVDPAKIHVIPNGVEDRLRPATADEIADLRLRYGLPARRMILYLGSIEPRKNVVRLAEAVDRIPGATLVLGGGAARGAAEIRGEIESRLGERVRYLGFVPDEDLPALYGAASVFAYPSIYEGFGIPPVEAMACGTAVAVANAASLPGVVGDAAAKFDPYDVEDIRLKLERILDDERHHADLVGRGIERAKMYQWNAVARETVRVYEDVARRAA